MKVKVLYFASLKERLLKGEDTVEVPEDVKTVEDLIICLRTTQRLRLLLKKCLVCALP